MSSIFESLDTELSEAATVDEVAHILVSLKESYGGEESTTLSVRELIQLYDTACHSLRGMTTEAPEKAQSIIPEFFIVPCVVEVESEASVAQHQLREHLISWIEQYPESSYVLLRNTLVDSVLTYLETSATRNACWLLSDIGYRSTNIVARLWSIVEDHDDLIGDAALATLTTICVESDSRERILAEVYQRAKKRTNNSLAHVMARFGTLESLEWLVNNWIHDENVDSIDSTRIIYIFQTLLKRNVDNADFQDRIWHQLKSLATSYPEQFLGHFYLGNIGPSCNSPLVISTLLEWLQEKAAEEEAHRWDSYLIGIRLEESIHPRQVEGWSHLATIPALSILEKFACLNTEFDGFVSTEAKDVKEKSWETLLRAGHKDALNWFTTAVAQEKGRFVQQHIMELLGCFYIDPLPQQVKEWIVDRLVLQKGQTDGRLLARSTGAIRIARSNATLEAFDVLLQTGVTIEEDGLRSSGIALADVALSLYRQNPHFVLERLVNILSTRGNPRHHRAAASFALERVIQSNKFLSASHIETLILVANDESRPLYERGNALSALAYAENWDLDNEIIPQFIEWAQNPDTWLGGGAMEVLIRKGYLVKQHAMLENVLGLTLINDKWELASNSLPVDWAGYFIGQLYYRNPEKFLPAIVSSLKLIDGRPLTQMMEWIRTFHSESKTLLPTSVSQALVDRIHTKQSSVYGETDVFQLLGEFSTDRLVKEAWDQVWDNWLPNIRATLADIIGLNQNNLPNQSEALTLLQNLTQDSYYAVRRAAYRSIGRVSPDMLSSLITEWSKAHSLDLRKRAAEACVWLGDGDQVNLGLTLLEHDSEKQVRTAAERARDEWHRKQWADKYLNRILSSTDVSNDAIFANWPYGDALSRIGNDDAISALELHIQNNTLPSHMRYWISRILKRLQKNWEDTTRSWPEPWVPFQGVMEQGRGKLIAKSEAELDVRYSLWQHLAATPQEVSDWGGILWTDDSWAFLEVDKGTLILEDGRQGRILTSRVRGSILIFKGNSAYPGYRDD